MHTCFFLHIGANLHETWYACLAPEPIPMACIIKQFHQSVCVSVSPVIDLQWFRKDIPMATHTHAPAVALLYTFFSV
jgi:hypothetical protein